MHDPLPAPMPADFAMEAPPLTDADLDAFLAYVDQAEADDLPAVRAGSVVATLDEASANPGPFAEHVRAAVPAYRFSVDDDETAEWALRRLAEYEATLADLAEKRDAWMRRIGEWFDQASRQPARRARFFTEHLEDYGRRHREANPKVATIHLPSGQIKTSKSSPAAEVVDDGAVADWIDLRLTRPPAGVDDAAIARWQAWCAAVRAAAPDPTSPLVVRTPKVYVGPLRKVVTITERHVADRVTIAWACDHTLAHTVPVETPRHLDPTPEVGEMTACRQCPFDAIDGVPPMVAVREVSREPLTEHVVLGPDGEPVPGTTVRPGGLTPKVVLA